MAELIELTYPSRGAGRPQIVLLGNGLEYKSGQVSWGQLLDKLTVSDSIPISKEQKERIPFPLLYHLISTHTPAPMHLCARDIQEEENRLSCAMKTMKNETNDLLDMLPSLDADHIMTTNYSYCIEKAFYPSLDFMKKSVRSRKRFRISDGITDGKAIREINYKIHSGYLAQSNTRKTGLWHIHGECAIPQSIILGHDRYGRLLQRIEVACGKQRYSGKSNEIIRKDFNSWPELFLYGDVYILGLALGESEFDLWWLLRRKQRERYADGKVFFYERSPVSGFSETRHLLLRAYGVQLCDAGCTTVQNYDLFYKKALCEIRDKISSSRITSL